MAKTRGNFNPMNMSALMRDAFRTLRMNVIFSGSDSDVHTIVVTSAVPGEGKTTVSIGLGVSMAESMKNTLVVECDCRRPSLGNRLKLRPEHNWIDVLYQQATLEEAVVATACPNLYFLDAEPGLVHSVELLNSARFRDMIEELSAQFDVIVFDTPPLGSFIDAAVLAKYADGVALVVGSGSRERRLIRETIEQIKKANAKLLGVVLNKANSHSTGYYRYGGYYYRDHKSDIPESGDTGREEPESAAKKRNAKKARSGQE